MTARRWPPNSAQIGAAPRQHPALLAGLFRVSRHALPKGLRLTVAAALARERQVPADESECRAQTSHARNREYHRAAKMPRGRPARTRACAGQEIRGYRVPTVGGGAGSVVNYVSLKQYATVSTLPDSAPSRDLALARGDVVPRCRASGWSYPLTPAGSARPHSLQPAPIAARGTAARAAVLRWDSQKVGTWEAA
jgi:hypothetical protein